MLIPCYQKKFKTLQILIILILSKNIDGEGERRKSKQVGPMRSWPKEENLNMLQRFDTSSALKQNNV